MNISEQALAAIKHHEGVRLRPYLCPAKLWTVGVGHVLYPEQARLPVVRTADNGNFPLRRDYPLKPEDDRVWSMAEVERKEAGRTEMKAWFSRFAYILPEDSYFDLQELTEVSRNGFNALFRHIRCISIHPTAAGKPRVVEASISFDEHRQDMNAKVLAGVTYAAGETTLCTRDGNNRFILVDHFNLYVLHFFHCRHLTSK